MEVMFLNGSDVSIGEGALDAVVGFVIVLAVLALLVGIFVVSGLIFRTKAMSRDKLFGAKEKTEPKPEFIPSSVPERNDDDETVAAISAAIAVLLSEEYDGDDRPEFVIRRISRNK